MIDHGREHRQLVYGARRPKAKHNIVAKVPYSLSGGISIEERRQRLPLPGWALPAAAYRPTTHEFSIAADNIALINFGAYKRAKKVAIKNEYSWKHYVSTEPKRNRRHNRGPRNLTKLPLPQRELDSGLKLQTSWLETIPDENAQDLKFAETTRKDGPKVRLLKRTLRNIQKDHDSLSNKYKTKLTGLKPQRWMPRSDPKVKIPKVNDWLERHQRADMSNAVKMETRDALGVDGHKRGRRQKRGKQQRGGKFFATRPQHWKVHPGDKSADDKSPLLSRSNSLTVLHKKKWYGHNQDWRSQRASVNSLPPLLPALTHAATISGGVRYLNPLLLPHEQSPRKRRRGWQN